jgi:hypothetical protein
MGWGHLKIFFSRTTGLEKLKGQGGSKGQNKPNVQKTYFTVIIINHNQYCQFQSLLG